jgi:hypothetical protein
MASTIRFTHFPSTNKPPDFIYDLSGVFKDHEDEIASLQGNKLRSDEVLALLRDDLVSIGYDVEKGKKARDKIHRPVTFGENGDYDLKYEVDAYNSEFRVSLEIEAGRGWQGNAIYRDLIQGMVMNGVDHLIVAVLNHYYSTGGDDYKKCLRVCEALSNHERIKLPYTITIVGY